MIMLASVVLGFKLQLNYFYPWIAVRNDSLKESNQWQLWHTDNKRTTQLHHLYRDDDNPYQEAEVTWQHVFVASRLFWISSLWPNGTFLLSILQIDLQSQTSLPISKVGRGGSGDADYWSEDFDNSKNCAQEKKVTQMRHEVREWTTPEKVWTSCNPITKTKTS